jgi:AGCS family alanine or glycine:cation symporter
VIVGFIDIAFALMAFPTVISALLLSPHVRRAARKYFENLKQEKRSERK